jgi:hypothetical protein
MTTLAQRAKIVPARAYSKYILFVVILFIQINGTTNGAGRIAIIAQPPQTAGQVPSVDVSPAH